MNRTKFLKSIRSPCSLCVDAGTVGSHSILDIVLYCYGKKPFLYQTIRNFKGDYNSYFNSVNQCLSNLNEVNIKIVSIVTDNLRAQVKALDHRDQNSIMKLSENTYIKNIIRVPCQCHVLNLAMKDFFSIESNSHVIPLSIRIVKIFHKKIIKRALQSVSPSFISTRWKNIFDIFNWVIIHRQRICTIITTSNRLIQEIIQEYKDDICEFLFGVLPDYYLLVHHYSMLIDIMENDSCLACYCPMIYSSFFSSLEETSKRVLSNNPSQLATEFISCIKNRIQKTGNLDLLYFISSFTIQGRDYIRKNFNFGCDLRDDDIATNVQYTLFSISEPNEKKIINFVSIDLQELIDLSQMIDSRHVNEDDDDESIFIDNQQSENTYSDDVYEDDPIENVDEEEFVQESINDFNIFEFGNSFLFDYYYNEGKNAIETSKIIDSYVNWIIKPIQDINPIISSINDDHDLWPLMSFRSDYGELSKIGKFLLLVPSSEASVERFFSHQRNAIKFHRYKTSKKLEEARMYHVSIE